MHQTTLPNTVVPPKAVSPDYPVFTTGSLDIRSAGVSMEDAQKLLSDGAEEGMACPCCEQFVRVYKRPLYSSMARWLVWLERTYADTGTWVDVKKRDARGGDYAKLQYWGLIEQKTSPRAKGKTRSSGLWRPTARGELFVKGKLSVPKHVYLYDGRSLGFSAVAFSINDALGDEYDYAAMLAGDKASV